MSSKNRNFPEILEIRNVRIPDFHSFTVAENMTVRIGGGKILSLSSSHETGEELSASVKTQGISLIDGKGMTLIPGMTNLHAHSAMTLLRGSAEDCNAIDWFNKHIWIYEQGLKADDIYIGTLLGGAEMLLNGVTAVADHYFAMDRAWRAYDELGMRADLSWAVFGVGDTVEQDLAHALDFTREYRGKSPRIGVSLGPHSPYLCPDDFLKKIVKIAEEEQLKIHIHAAEDERQIEISMQEKGKTPIEVLRDTGVLKKAEKGTAPISTILAHSFYATDRDLAIMAESSCITAHCPKTYLRFGDSHNFVPRGLEAGIQLGLGTDGPASNSTMDIAEAARLAALMGKAASGNAQAARVQEILPMMFAGGEIFGRGDARKIVPGANADLVLLDLDSPDMFPGTNLFADLLYGLNGRHVHTVIVDGKVLVQNGKLLTVDYRALKEEAGAIAHRLLSTKADTPMQEY